MEESFWFGMTVAFTCPSCRCVNSDRLAVFGPESIRAQLTARPHNLNLACTQCKAPLPKSCGFSLSLLKRSPSQLQAGGFRIYETRAGGEKN